jgi:hypothetical protein
VTASCLATWLRKDGNMCYCITTCSIGDISRALLTSKVPLQIYQGVQRFLYISAAVIDDHGEKGGVQMAFPDRQADDWL